MPVFANRKTCRSNSGSQMAELPPALFILFLVIFFPLLDMLYLFLAYCAGWYLNQVEMRQIACQTPPSLTKTVTTAGTTYSAATYGPPTINVPQSLTWHGFMGVDESPDSPQVTFIPVTVNFNQIGVAEVTTTVSIKPFMTIGPGREWLPKVAGLNEPITFVYKNSIMQEEQYPP